MSPHDHEHMQHATQGTAAPEHPEHVDHREHSEHADHSGHAGGHMHHVMMFRRLFWIMLVLAAPVVALDPMVAHLLGYHVPTGGVLSWIPPVLGTVLYVGGGRPFLTGAVSEVRSRQPGMMLLIALAITVAFVASWAATLGLLASDLAFWWELALLVVIMLLGHWIEMRSLAQTSSALDSLAALLPDEAERVTDAGTETVAPADLAAGDVVIVRPGSTIPADGEIVDGSAHLDESMITGESRPVEHATGDRVVAGTVATDSGLRVRITATGQDTALAGIQKLVADAQSSSSRAQLLADRAAAWLFWFALGAAIVTAVVWLALGHLDTALERVITVLVIACPHALGLAIPLVVSIATGRAASAGVLITDREALEGMRRIDTVLLDKTGTLTEGTPAVTGLVTAPEGADTTEEHVLALAAAAESDSEHPLAQAVQRAAHERGLEVPASTAFSSEPATGVSATVDGRRIAVGGPRLLEDHGLTALEAASAWSGEGATVLHVLDGDEILGALRVADAVRPESRQAIDELHERGLEVAMVTGDAQAVADAVARELGIDRVYAQVRPEDKSDRVAELQHEGRRVAMVGDGVNDAPALARADVGIAIGAGTDVAIASAGIVLAGSDPRTIVSVIDLSTAAWRKMLQNLGWAAGYNVIAVPLAAGVLAPIGFVMPMSVGALLMSASTVVVALNAQLLRRLDLRPRDREHG